MDDEPRAVRAEWRAEEEQWTRAAFERWEHDRTLADVLRAAQHRGDGVAFGFPEITWSGTVSAVGRDVVRIRPIGTTTVDVRLAPDAPFVLRVREGVGADPLVDTAVATFAARLRELDGTAVCIGTAVGVVEGTLRTGRDQLRVTDADGGAAYVPAASAWWVRPLTDD